MTPEQIDDLVIAAADVIVYDADGLYRQWKDEHTDGADGGNRGAAPTLVGEGLAALFSYLSTFLSGFGAADVRGLVVGTVGGVIANLLTDNLKAKQREFKLSDSDIEKIVEILVVRLWEIHRGSEICDDGKAKANGFGSPDGEGNRK